MRNLKKVLSLVLCVAVMLSVMVLGAGAAFSDQDQIENTEAVDACSALNIIGGYEDGSYHPERNIKRSEVTKMICVALNGGKEPNLAIPNTPTFTDVRGTADGWAEKYIESCVAQGIVSGVGGGRFAPAGNVTASQLAKMLLVAIGYDAEIEKFTGNAWETNVNVIATQKGIYEGLESIDVSSAVTRDNAAQMVWNAMQATMVTYKYTIVTENGQLVSKVELVDKTDGQGHKLTLLKDKYNAVIEYGYMTGYTYDSAKKVWEYTFSSDAQFNSAALTANDKIGTAKKLKSSTDYTDMFGKQVRVIYKSDVNDKVYGVYINDSQVLATGATGQIGDIDTTANTVVIDGTSVKFNNVSAPQMVFTRNNSTAVSTSGVDTIAELKADNNAFTFEVVDNNGDGKGEAIVITPMTIAKISYTGTDSVTLGAPINTTHKVADISIYDGYAKDDWVAQIAAANSDTGIVTYEKMEVKTGTITGVKTVDGVKNYLIDGVWYTDGASTNLVTLNVNDKIDFVAVGSKFFYTKISESGLTGKDVVMVVTSGKTNGNDITAAEVQTKLLFSDGTTKVVGLSKVDDETAKYNGATDGNAAAAVGHLYTYRIDSDGNYELTKLSAINTAGYDGVGTTAAYNNKTVGGYELADDAIVFALTSGDQGTAAATNKGKVFTGREIKNNYTTTSFGTAQTSGYVSSVYSKVNGFDYARVAVLVGNVTIDTGSNYGYLVSDAYEGREGADTYRYFEIWTANGKLSVKEKSSNGLDGLKAGAVITYDVTDTEGVVKNVSLPVVTTSAVTGWDASTGKIQFNSGLSNKVTNDTVVIYVDSSKQTGSEGGSISIADSPSAGEYNNNVRYICASSAAYVDLLLVDINNDMKANPAAGLLNTSLDSSATVSDVVAAINSDATRVTVASTPDFTGAVNIREGQTVTFTNGATISANVTGTGTIAVPSSTTLTIGADATIDADINASTATIDALDDVTFTGDVTVKTLKTAASKDVENKGNLVITDALSSTNNNNGNIWSAEGSSLKIGSVQLLGGTAPVFTIKAGCNGELQVTWDGGSNMLRYSIRKVNTGNAEGVEFTLNKSFTVGDGTDGAILDIKDAGILKLADENVTLTIKDGSSSDSTLQLGSGAKVTNVGYASGNNISAPNDEVTSSNTASNSDTTITGKAAS